MSLSFSSGRFNSIQFGWSILEKEAYAILATLERTPWIAATAEGFDLYTDHNNHIFIFDPTAVVPDISQTTFRKFLRWAVRLSMYHYTCFHIKGQDNVWADLLGRWSAPPTLRRRVRISVLPSSSEEDFEWPSREFNSISQKHADSERPPNLDLVEGLWCNPMGAVSIPDEDSDPQLRLCIIAHTGPSGHRVGDSTPRVLRKSYFWSTISTDVRTLVRGCLHCLRTFGRESSPPIWSVRIW